MLPRQLPSPDKRYIAINSSQVVAWLKNSQIVQAFPFVRLTRAETRSSCCGQAPVEYPDTEAIKRALATLTEDRQRLFLHLTGLPGVEIRYRDPDGSVVVRF